MGADRPFPLGAHVEGDRVRFAVASLCAEAVEVCLIDPDGGERRVELPERTFGVWHGVVPGAGAGDRYGFRVHGPYQPARGLRCNPAKLLVDPYARRIAGPIIGTVTDLAAATGYDGDPFTGLPSTVDSLRHVPLSVVTADGGPGTGPRPDVPWADTVVYELHVRGFTMLHPDVPPAQRGTYLGLAHPAVIEHLTRLGVTTVELLPVHAIGDEPGLLRSGRRNYWGYSTLGFLTPHAGYASVPGAEVDEFRTMVAALHAAGIEVVLDVVYNHTCEGGVDGPTLSFRGLDAPAYYVHRGDGTLVDLTGCGNTLDAASPVVVRLVLDSLRYWAGELGVDGFRFDLASVLGRPRGGPFDPHAPLLTAIAADPILAQRKLIAEPWDATGEGYRVGGFGVQWAEWNGRFRDTVRDYWRGAVNVRDLAYRLAGSSDLYALSCRRPWQSINFVTAHDGFTLRDLVSYSRKHNEANGERGADGTDDNRSDNHGVEGETSDPAIVSLRRRQARNLLATLLLSTGTPMLVAGDELWRTQRGNNNPYCLDDETSWVDWTGDPVLLGFARRLLALRHGVPALRQPEFFDGRVTRSGNPDLAWLRADGQEMTEADWFDEERRTIGMWIDGTDVRLPDGSTAPPGDSWLLVLHAGSEDVPVTLPDPEYGSRYELVLDTWADDGGAPATEALPARAVFTMPGRTVRLFRVLR
jgi:isoamylase